MAKTWMHLALENTNSYRRQNKRKDGSELAKSGRSETRQGHDESRSR